MSVEDANKMLIKTKETLVLNLLDHVVNLDDLYRVDCYEEPRKGIYLSGSIDPIFYADSKYFWKNDQSVNIPILNIHELLTTFRTVIDSTEKVIIRGDTLFKQRKFLQTQPDIPVMAIKAAVATIIKYLNSLCSFTHVNDISYNLYRLVKNEYRDLVNNDEFDVIFYDLVSKVQDFVGEDTWHIYFYKVRGTSIIIQKTIDYRIYDWYRIKYGTEDI